MRPRGTRTSSRDEIELPARSTHLVTEQVSPTAATGPTTKDMMMTTTVVRLLTLGVAATAPLTAAGLSPAAAGAVNAPVLHAPGTVAQRGQARLEAALTRQIAAQLERVPGGRRTAVNEISYENGKVVYTFVAPSADRLDKQAWCKKGSFCFWAGEDFTTEPPLTQIGVYLKCNEWMDLGPMPFR